MEAARAVIAGGAQVIQWRDKTRDKGEQLPIIREIISICKKSGVVSIINDHLDLALIAGSDGIHLGQRDLPLTETRPLFPNGKIIGISTATIEEAKKAEANGADYDAVGSIYPTASKEVTRPAGLDTLQRVVKAVSIPVVAIGGINAQNITPVVESGADAICVISAVLSKTNIEFAAESLSSKIRTTKNIR
mgnify:CR=1 FL=1